MKTLRVMIFLRARHALPLLFVLLAACQGPVVLVTVTPGPVIDATPTREVIDNFPINANWNFEAMCKLGSGGEVREVRGSDGVNRSVCDPPQWDIVWRPNPQVAGNNPHPEVLDVYEPNRLRFEVSSRGGVIGVAGHASTFPGRRYLIKLTGRSSLSVLPGSQFVPGDLYGYCRFDNLAGATAQSGRWQVGLQGDFEVLCPFETVEDRTVRFEALVNNTWQVLNGQLDYLTVEVIQIRADEYSDAVEKMP